MAEDTEATDSEPESHGPKQAKPKSKLKSSTRQPGVKKKKPGKKIKRKENFLATLLEYEDVPLIVTSILEKQDALEVLSAKETDTLFESLSETVKKAAELIFQDAHNEVALKWLKSVALLTLSIVENLSEDEPIKESISHITSLLGFLLKLEIDIDTKDIISELCSLLLEKNVELSDQVFFLTVSFLLDFILTSDANLQLCKKFIKRLNTLKNTIAKLQLDSKACEPLVAKFVSALESKIFVTVKDGRQFLAFLLTLDQKLLLKFHQAIKNVLPLPFTKKTHANGYGEVYYLAWLHSGENKEMRQMIEIKCFQNYMASIFTIQRQGLEMSNLGHNVFTILSFLHNKREHLRLSKTITSLYTPLIWRYLRFENNLIRCNAAEVFFDVYPFEYHGEARPERIMHLERQHKEMADLLLDKCHLVRIISIRGVFLCMKSVWSTFPAESLQKLFDIIMNDCVNDSSCNDVRSSTYQGFATLLENEQSHEFLASVLPSLRNYINDTSDKVRLSFVKLLQKVKDTGMENLKYWNITDVKTLTNRLAKEQNVSVAKALGQLIFSQIFVKNSPDSVILKRLARLLQMDPKAGRKLIQYSHSLLPYDDAYRTMMVILSSITSHVKDKIAKLRCKESADDSDVSEDLKPKPKKRKKSRPLSERTNNANDDSAQNSSKSSHDSNDSSSSSSKISDSTSSSKAEESVASSKSEKERSAYDVPVVSHGLIDIVSLLWIIHSKTLNSKEKETDLENLYELSLDMIPIFLKYYKGTETFFGVLQLASLIPLSKLIPVSTIASACVSQLKHCGHTLPLEESRCIVNSLCAWNRGNDILYLVYDWLNEAFKVENLNYSVYPANKSNKQRKIRFEREDFKPICGLNLIDIMLSNPLDKERVLRKHYDQLLDLFNFMERIKPLIEKRLKKQEELNHESLSDEFLTRCLWTYTKLGVILHKDRVEDISNSMTDNNFSVVEFYSELLKWTESTLIEALETRSDPAACIFINIVVKAGCTMMSINRIDKQTMAEVLKLLSRCLNCGENGIQVLESAVKFMNLSMNVTASKYSAKTVRHMYIVTIPHFLESIFMAATFRNYDQETILECIQDITAVKSTIKDLLMNYLNIHAKDKTNSILPRVINVLLKAVINSISLEILKDNVAVPVTKFNSLPFFTNMILTHVNSQATFSSIFLNCLKKNLSELYLNNGVQLLAAISLLYTLSMNSNKFKPADFSATVKLACEVLLKYESDPDLNSSTKSCSIMDSSQVLEKQDVQNQGTQLLQTISEKIGLFF